MKEKTKDFLRSFASCLQVAKIYGCQHPEFNKRLEDTYQRLNQVLARQPELVIAVVGSELASGGDIFFDLSKRLSSLINVLVDAGAQKLTFKQGLQNRELRLLFVFFSSSGGEEANLREYFNSEGIKNIEAGTIGKIESGRGKSGKTASQPSIYKRYSQSVSDISSSINDIISGQAADFSRLEFIIDSIIGGVSGHYQQILRLSKLKAKDQITFVHLLNVAILSVYFSKNLGFAGPQCRKIGIAALFHDMGKLYISGRILKGGKLSEKEFQVIKSHSLTGAWILLNYIEKAGITPPVVALEHHLRYNSSGYPKLRFPHRIHISSVIVSLCDVYDALSQRRSYKRDYPPEQIYQIMKEGRGSQFNPGLFDAFFRFMGVWPNGTIVLLSNAEVAVVRKQNPDDIFSPRVEIISGTSRRRLNLKNEKGSLEIKKSLNPYKEGREYLTF